MKFLGGESFVLWKNNLIEAIQAKKKTSVDIVTDEFPLDCYEHSELILVQRTKSIYLKSISIIVDITWLIGNKIAKNLLSFILGCGVLIP